MIYKKILIRDGDSGSLSKALNSRYNYKYKFKWISIREIQITYIFIL